MASYDIIFKPSVEKDLRSLPKSVIAREIQGTQYSFLQEMGQVYV
jgi:mRNA-degrading endonuclease RelE of RelBE toxin-antitoxin system